MIFSLGLKHKRVHCGFTLVELVTTILIVGIVAVFVIPRLIPQSSYSAYSLRNEFISELRQVQLRAMNNSDRCYRISVSPSGYQLSHYSQTINTASASCNTANLVRVEVEQPFQGGAYIELASSNATSFSLEFDNSGRSNINCSGLCFNAVADETLGIAIESEGYIHGL
ncbi:Tfp pilus assembly protein FimT/FimU [Shewanella sp. UCD-KL21]|uniref:pilus assembly FimT family protein n=1 Tax=Shewanella sp. UCD-KL21 TaxID=1917164 RepID=UPI000970B6C1|nr:prepilin-type N-terminal cleavage/methylation domain-containing protein [Shewanella sp. UCD-KL21]